jgi:hypothetical protein
MNTAFIFFMCLYVFVVGSLSFQSPSVSLIFFWLNQ